MEILHIEPLRYNDRTRQMLQAQARVVYADVQTHDELVEAIRHAPYEALFVKLGIPIDKAVLEAAPHLRYIVTPTTGLNHIDEKEASRRQIEVVSLKGESAFLNQIQSTSEHTWALLLALIRRLPAALEDVKEGRWRREPFLGMELNGKTLGIIGYGRLGRIVAGYGKAFQMQVRVYDTDASKLETLPEGIQAESLDQLLAQSDVISIHIPFEEENRRFIDAAKIRTMRTGVVLLNTARGEVVDEEALLAGLASGKIAGAAIDVVDGDSRWEQEVPEHHPLLAYACRYDNLLITPHIGGYALESIERTRHFITEKFLKATRKI